MDLGSSFMRFTVEAITAKGYEIKYYDWLEEEELKDYVPIFFTAEASHLIYNLECDLFLTIL
tara:strand:+ start:1243 stop:1428 length:186 start_codon:yes stop_codon:yes gene_type:complete